MRPSKNQASMMQEAIRQEVAKAIASRTVLRVQPLARRIAKTCPRCGMTCEAIAEEIEKAGMAAEVPLDIGKTSADRQLQDCEMSIEAFQMPRMNLITEERREARRRH